LFEYTDVDIFNPPALPKDLNGMVHVDVAMHGLITAIWKVGKFSGFRYETLLIDPYSNTILAKKFVVGRAGRPKTF
jgi:hypothetical protein